MCLKVIPIALHIIIRCKLSDMSKFVRSCAHISHKALCAQVTVTKYTNRISECINKLYPQNIFKKRNIELSAQKWHLIRKCILILIPTRFMVHKLLCLLPNEIKTEFNLHFTSTVLT